MPRFQLNLCIDVNWFQIIIYLMYRELHITQRPHNTYNFLHQSCNGDGEDGKETDGRVSRTTSEGCDA